MKSRRGWNPKGMDEMIWKDGVFRFRDGKRVVMMGLFNIIHVHNLKAYHLIL